MKNLERKGVVYGVLTAAVLIGYFIVMKAFGLAHNVELRAFNAVFMFAGVFLAIKSYRNASGKNFEFLPAIGLGLVVSVTVAVVFCAFFAVFLLSNPLFLESIRTNEVQGIHINIIGLCGLIFIEAMASGVLFTYASMQWLKSSRFAAKPELKPTK